MAEETKTTEPEKGQPTPNHEQQPVVVPPNEKDEIAKLQKQLEAAKRAEATAREEAARAQAEAAQRATEAVRFRSEAERSQYYGLERAIEGASARMAQLKADLAAAWNAGDVAKAADAQVEIGALSARMSQMEDGREQMKARLQQTAQQPQPQAQPQITDPVERLARGLSPRSASWVRLHPDAAQDIPKLQAVAQYAQHKMGLEPDSDAFFQYVEEELGYRKSPRQSSQPAAYQRRNGSMPPVQRSQGPVGRPEMSASDIQDTPAIEEAAATSGITTKAYKEQYIKLFNEGKITDVLGVLH